MLLSAYSARRPSCCSAIFSQVLVTCARAPGAPTGMFACTVWNLCARLPSRRWARWLLEVRTWAKALLGKIARYVAPCWTSSHMIVLITPCMLWHASSVPNCASHVAGPGSSFWSGTHCNCTTCQGHEEHVLPPCLPADEAATANRKRFAAEASCIASSALEREKGKG